MHPITKRLVQFKLGFPNNNMDLIDEINYKLSRMPNVRKIDPRQLPCQFCEHDFYARKEMLQVLSLNKDNSNFIKELMAVYHTILHCDIQHAMQILYFKDIRSVMGIQILAKKIDGRDGPREENLIYKLCKDIIVNRYIFEIFMTYTTPHIFLVDAFASEDAC